MNIIVCTRYRPTDDDDDGRHDYDKHNNHDGGDDYQDDHLYFGVVHSSNNLTMSGITLRGAPTKEAKHNINITPIIIITNQIIIIIISTAPPDIIRI